MHYVSLNLKECLDTVRFITLKKFIDLYENNTFIFYANRSKFKTRRKSIPFSISYA